MLFPEKWKTLPTKHPDVYELFYPPHLSKSSLVKETIDRKWPHIMQQSLEAAANHIYYVIVDIEVCELLLNSEFQNVLKKFCSSIQTLSVLIKSSSKIVDFIEHVLNEARNLCKMCIFVIKNDDLEHFEKILSLCSGVHNQFAPRRNRSPKPIDSVSLAALDNFETGSSEPCSSR